MADIAVRIEKLHTTPDTQGIETGVQSWSGRQDLNLRPSDPKSDALAKLRHAPKTCIHYNSIRRENSQDGIRRILRMNLRPKAEISLLQGESCAIIK